MKTLTELDGFVGPVVIIQSNREFRRNLTYGNATVRKLPQRFCWRAHHKRGEMTGMHVIVGVCLLIALAFIFVLATMAQERK